MNIPMTTAERLRVLKPAAEVCRVIRGNYPEAGAAFNCLESTIAMIEYREPPIGPPAPSHAEMAASNAGGAEAIRVAADYQRDHEDNWRGD